MWVTLRYQKAKNPHILQTAMSEITILSSVLLWLYTSFLPTLAHFLIFYFFCAIHQKMPLFSLMWETKNLWVKVSQNPKLTKSQIFLSLLQYNYSNKSSSWEKLKTNFAVTFLGWNVEIRFKGFRIGFYACLKDEYFSLNCPRIRFACHDWSHWSRWWRRPGD